MTSDSQLIRYEGFLSYARADERVAAWLHRALEQFRIPGKLGIPARRFRPLFRDHEELASSPDLSEALRGALGASANLIVVCSPAAAQSRWVDEELRVFRALRPEAPIVCVLAAGDPDDPATVFPPSLLEHAVPLAIDMRGFPRQRRTALLRVAAVLLGVSYDTLRQRHRQRQRRRLGWASAGATAAAAVVAVVTYEVATAPPCTGSASRFAEVWNDGSRAGLEARFSASGLPYAADSWQRVQNRLDAYAGAWIDTHTDACAATRIREEQSAQLMDLRMACLDERRFAFATLVDTLREADADVLEHAVDSAGSLPGLARCSDRAQLEASLPLPEDPAARQRIAQAKATAIEVETLLATGRTDDAMRLLAADGGAVPEDYPPVAAEWLILRGSAEARSGAGETARSTLYEATSKAVLSRDSELIARAWLELSRLHVDFRTRINEAFDVLRVTESYVSPLPAEHPLRASFHHLRGQALLRVSRLDEGNADLTRAIALGRATNAPQLDEFLLTKSWALSLLHDVGQAGRFSAEALALTRTTVGEAHPKYARALIEAARIDTALGNVTQATRMLEAALAILEAVYPQGSPDVASTLDQLGWALKNDGRYEEALAALERGVALEQSFETPRLRTLGSLNNTLGDIYLSLGDYERAERHMQQALDAWTRTDGGTAVGVGLNNLGNLANRRGDHLAAETYCARALENDSAYLDAENPSLAFPLTCLGEALLGQRRAADALAPLSRAEALRNRPDLAPGALAWTRWLYGRALAESGGDVERGLGYVRESRRVFADMGAAAESELGDLDTWLAGFPAR